MPADTANCKQCKHVLLAYLQTDKDANMHASQPEVLLTGCTAVQSSCANSISSSGFGKGYSLAVL